MTSGTLYTYPDNFRAFKILIAAQYSKFNVQLAKNFSLGETNKTPDFLSKFPLGKVPAFETSDGTCLTESNAIAYYVSNDQLKGKSKLEQAQVLQWISFADSEVHPASSTWVFPCLGMMQFNKQSTDRAKTEVKNALNTLNQHLATRTYLVGQRISLADICVASTLLALYEHVLDAEFRKPFGNVNRWFTTIVNQPQVKEVIGNFQLCQKMAEFDSKKFAEFQARLGQSPDNTKKAKKEGGGGDKKEKKKEEKKKPEIKEEPEEQDEMDEILANEPKSKDPFEQFPKGTFVMDDFKRSYSNEDTDVSIPYFWEKFDPENYSIWFCEYKYNNELEKVFMRYNLISGMYQRLDKLRKNAFASMCLFGEDKNSTISGIGVWKSQELAFKLSEDWQIDYEVYDWKKLDPAAAETKTLVKNYLAWTGADKDGRKFNQGKIFK